MTIKLDLPGKDKGIMSYKNWNSHLGTMVCSILIFKWSVDEFLLKKRYSGFRWKAKPHVIFQSQYHGIVDKILGKTLNANPNFLKLSDFSYWHR